MNTIFDEVRERVDILEACDRYGVEVKRGKALCPFHADSSPSLSFKNNRYHCFSCGVSGSVIDLVKQLLGLSDIEAVKRLNEDFQLGLELGKPPDRAQITQYRQDNQLYEGFQKWENRAYITLAAYFRALRAHREQYRPTSPDEALHPLFIEALHNMDMVEYWLEILRCGEFGEKICFYKQNKKVVNLIGDKIRENRADEREPNPGGAAGA